MATRTRLTIDISPEQRRRIRQAAAARDMTVSEFVNAAVDEKLDEAGHAETETEAEKQARIARGREAIKQVDAWRKTLGDRQYSESAVDLIRRSREERDAYLWEVLEEAREQNRQQ